MRSETADVLASTSAFSVSRAASSSDCAMCSSLMSRSSFRSIRCNACQVWFTVQPMPPRSHTAPCLAPVWHGSCFVLTVDLPPGVVALRERVEPLGFLDGLLLAGQQHRSHELDVLPVSVAVHLDDPTRRRAQRRRLSTVGVWLTMCVSPSAFMIRS